MKKSVHVSIFVIQRYDIFGSFPLSYPFFFVLLHPVRKIHSLFYITLLLLLFSCIGHKYPQALVDAESLMTDYPDSASNILAQIGPEINNASESVKRYYQLLRIEADDKANKMNVSPDSIKDLVYYFKEDGDKAMFPKACYYAGRVYSDLNNAPLALSYFQEALKAMDERDINDQHLKSVIYSQMGYLYLFQYIYDEAERCFRASYNIGVVIKDTASIFWGLRDIGATYLWQEKYNESLSYFLKADNVATMTNKHELIAQIQKDIANVYNNLHDYNHAKEYMQEPMRYINLLDSNSVLRLMSEIYYNVNKVDSFLNTVKVLEQIGDVFSKERVYDRLTSYHLEQGELSKARACFDLFKLYNDSANALTKTDELQKVHSLYNIKKEEAKIAKLEKHNLIRGFLLLVLFLALLALATYIYSYRRRTLERFKRFRILQREIQRNNQYVVKADNSSRELNRNDIKSSHIYNVVSEKVASQLVLNNSEWQEIEILINDYYPDFKTRLLDLYDFSVHQYHLCLLIKMELSPSSIGILTAHTNSSITHTRKRLYKKCFGQDGTGEQWDAFIRSL